MIEGRLVDEALEKNLLVPLIEMIAGENEYCDQESFDKMDLNSSRLRGLALQHLRFIEKFEDFGDEKWSMMEGEYVHSNYPDYFKAWKLAGCPGISISQLERMIKELSV